MADENTDFRKDNTANTNGHDIDDIPDDDTSTNADRTPVVTEESSPSNDDSEPADADDPESHLANVPDGAGCTEIWEHLSAGRDGE